MGKKRQMALAAWIVVSMKMIKGFLFIYDVITWPIYAAIYQPWEALRKSNMIRSKSATGDPSGPYVNCFVQFDDEEKELKKKLRTLYEIFKFSVERFGEAEFQGTRDVYGEEMEPQPNGKLFKKLILADEYKYETFNQLKTHVVDFGHGLRDLGQEPNKSIVLFAETRAEWLISSIACFKHNIPIVTLYATLGDEALAHGINETESECVITSVSLLPKFKTLLKDCPKIKTLIYMTDSRVKVSLTDYPESVKIVSFAAVEAKGKTVTTGDSDSPPTDKDTAIIMYTSGSTGTPKGVILSHANIVNGLFRFTEIEKLKIRLGDTYLAFLPLAHVLELQSEMLCLKKGIKIAYSSPNTVSNMSTMIKKGCKGDAPVAKPTFMSSVPLVLDRIYKAVMDAVHDRGNFSSAIFILAFEYKLKWIRRGYQTPLVNRLIFFKLRNMLGGRLRLMVTGGAPLSPDTHDFIRVCLCCPLLQGYGLTETCASATCTDADDLSTGSVGAPPVEGYIKLEDWVEGGYRTTDKPNPRGELIIGGDTISSGYYKMPEKTKEDFFDEDGIRWFRSGDIGEILDVGTIRIIDRKKDLLKLQGGEYVSLGKVEAEYKTLGVVDNICVYGESSKTNVIALVVPNRRQMDVMAKALGKENLSFEELCVDPSMEKRLTEMMAEHGKKAKLDRTEIPTRAKFVPDIWTSDSGFVTAAFKLRRKPIQDHYQNLIDQMYN